MFSDRPGRDAILMATAQLYAERSTCSRAHVGVVIAQEGRSISTGYNGAPAGMPHCDHTCRLMSGCFNLTHTTGPDGMRHDVRCPAGASCKKAIHAEANAIVYAARHGMAVAGATLFTTLSPCMPCAQLIVAAGIVRVWYAASYRDMSPLDFMSKAGLGVEPF